MALFSQRKCGANKEKVVLMSSLIGLAAINAL